MSKTEYETNFKIIDKTEKYKKYIRPIECDGMLGIVSKEEIKLICNNNNIIVIFIIDIDYQYCGSYNNTYPTIYIEGNYNTLLRNDIYKYIKHHYFDKNAFDVLRIKN